MYVCVCARVLLRDLEYVSGINSAVMNIVCKSAECEGRGRAMLFTTSRLRIKCCAVVLLLVIYRPLSFFPSFPHFISQSRISLRCVLHIKSTAMIRDLGWYFPCSLSGVRERAIDQLHVLYSSYSLLISLSYLSEVGKKSCLAAALNSWD